ncbi:MAG: AAA family ATPase [Chloroflexi bacterium]|nr:AAA family ATPase [Chloroflexota bacterium]
MNDAVIEARDRVNEAFSGFIGNEDAVYSIKRAIIVALSTAPEKGTPVLAKTFLLSGPPSTGKTEIAKRITNILGIPFVRLDGRAVRSREKLFETVDEALLARNTSVTRNGERSGIPLIEYPPFAVFVDEIHLVGGKTQEALLTMLEADDRTMLLDGEKGRRIAVVAKAAFIFATTKPADLDRAFRSRCIEIQLRRYTVEEVQTMVHQRFPRLPDSAIETIATCSRLSPRQAFAMAQEVEDEIFLDERGDVRACVKRVMNGRSILYVNGITRDDMRYLATLNHEKRAIGESVVMASLYDVDPTRISEDIEPYLLQMRFIVITPKGRQLTAYGSKFLNQAYEEGYDAGFSRPAGATIVGQGA